MMIDDDDDDYYYYYFYFVLSYLLWVSLGIYVIWVGLDLKEGYRNTNNNYTVDLPINTTASCSNFCGPQSTCAITGEQCSSDYQTLIILHTFILFYQTLYKRVMKRLMSPQAQRAIPFISMFPLIPVVIIL
jgi:hypothetical protein